MQCRRLSATVILFLSTPIIQSAPTPSVTKADLKGIAGHTVQRIYRATSEGAGSHDLVVPTALYQDPKGVLWIATVNNLHSFDENANRWSTYSVGAGGPAAPLADTISWSSDGKLWVRSVTLNYLRAFDGNSWENVVSVGSLATLSGPLFSSKSGRIWLAQESGIFAYKKGKWSGPVTPPTRVGHLFNVYSPPRMIDEQVSNKRGSVVRFAAVGLEDREGELWMGTRSAVLRFSPSNRSWEIHKMPIRLSGLLGVYDDAVGRIWFCDTAGQVVGFDKANNSWSVHDLPRALRESKIQAPDRRFSVNGLCLDKSGQVLFATSIGLISFKERTNEWSVDTVANSALLDNNISTLLVDKIGRIWLGTGQGIVVLEP